MSDLGDRLKRYRLLEAVVRLADPAELQIAWRARTRLPVVELLRDFAQWWYLAPELAQAGALSEHLLSALDELGRSATRAFEVTETGGEGAVGSGLEADLIALLDGPSWSAVRHDAANALLAFGALGLPIPRSTDDDFEARRDDAP